MQGPPWRCQLPPTICLTRVPQGPRRTGRPGAGPWRPGDGRGDGDDGSPGVATGEGNRGVVLVPGEKPRCWSEGECIVCIGICGSQFTRSK